MLFLAVFVVLSVILSVAREIITGYTSVMQKQGRVLSSRSRCLFIGVKMSGFQTGLLPFSLKRLAYTSRERLLV